MGYLKIPNLYADQSVLLFKECYALEKIHGTSAHVAWKNGQLHLHPGGVKHEDLILVMPPGLSDAFVTLGHADVTVHGEAYGGKCQRMSGTYGIPLRFIAFDVKIGETWLDVPNAHDVATKLGLEFVHYKRIPTDLPAIDAERDADSEQAIRNGVGPGKPREGIVLRPLVEMVKSNGNRLIAKHKRDEFRETGEPRKVLTGEKLVAKSEADAVALDWVTDMRLAHVLDKLSGERDMKLIPAVIAAMQADIRAESEGEILWSKDVERAIGKRAVQLYKASLGAEAWGIKPAAGVPTVQAQED